MSTVPGKSSSRIALIVVLVPIAAVAWFMAPWFLPVWRWQNLSFEELAVKTGVKEAELRKAYTVIIRHAERGKNDPLPWQIVTMEPAWPHADEHEYLVRAAVVSDRTGQPPSGLLLNSGHRWDRFFRVTAWRLPPGSCGFNAKRPVLVYDGGSLEKLTIGEAERAEGLIKDGNWENDDAEVEDGWRGAEGR